MHHEWLLGANTFGVETELWLEVAAGVRVLNHVMTRSMAVVVEGQDRASSRMATKPGDVRDFNSSFIVVWVFAG